MLKHAQFVTLHVPLVEATRHLVNDANIGLMRHGAVLLNFSREGVVSNAAVLEALAAKRLSALCLRLPRRGDLHGHPQRGRAAAPGRLARARPRRTAP